LGEIVLVGLGLNDEKGISLRGLEEVRTANNVFIELYTSLLPDFSFEHLEKISEREVHIISRRELEDENAEIILAAARRGKVCLLVPGDPLIATTHVALRIAAERQGIRTSVVHGASVLSAVIGLSGLHCYKFGKTVTIPFPHENPSATPYETIAQNRRMSLHTLCLLDINVDAKSYLRIQDALGSLLEIEKKRKMQVVEPSTLVVGVARAGSSTPTVKAGFARDMLRYDFGDPPHSLIFPAVLHFTEAEALMVLGGAPEEIKREVR
jgi:diphthine synthase